MKKNRGRKSRDTLPLPIFNNMFAIKKFLYDICKNASVEQTARIYFDAEYYLLTTS